ncbi:AMP-binding protein [Corynebacterium pseudokroppenstedtii]|uniref:AMP-binding protein n=1 Tax=Corynebacterium pseudokroppenstedtii TaxID=2804917 RepID=A0AAU0PXV4_9CORY|nr:AMP-binding protein [Corynebacterium pseudokroppenstedtii]QRP14146.1 AMP-binding protein [Corynebacterium kroppenstedtii]MBY0790271.1 AMP-binding protein [Corynebacterium pseudokroppenstedtii]MCF6793190.1 AMP-binding protein [Corynebacterium pseudokroppenstedtii]MCF8702010.1 AMP-binding protein [Corynebacterium pseudokroppenstedtii]MCG2635842.1 AMP-binding protein [Corynebacterium pseudokroppenstedtii]
MTQATIPSPNAKEYAQREGGAANGCPWEDVQRYRELGIYTGDTHWALFERARDLYDDAPFAVDRYRSLTWSDVRDSAHKVGNLLRGLGIAEGDAVIVQLPNAAVHMEAIFGIWSIGAVPVFALPAHGADDIAHFARTAPAGVRIAAVPRDKHAKRVEKGLLEEIPELTTIQIDPRADEPWDTPVINGAEIDGTEVSAEVSGENSATNANSDADADSTPWPSPERDPQALAFLQLSGGTTGTPKLIPRSHDDYLYSVRRSDEVCDMHRGDVFLVVMPASHNFTMSSPGILGALHTGATVVYVPDPSPTTIRRYIHAHRGTHMALVPPLLISLLNSRDEAQNPDPTMETMKTVWVGGAKLSASAAERVAPELGINLQQVFGMAEGLVNYTKLGGNIDEIVNTQGVPMSRADEVRVVNDEGAPVDRGTPGHLHTRGPYTIRRYHRNPTANASSFTDDGFYITGDIVTVSADGAITVTGRAKDQINRGGEKIAPESVENCLLKHPAIHDVSVVGIPDDVMGEKIRALIILRDGYKPSGTDASRDRGTEGSHSTAASYQPLTATQIKKFVRESGLSRFAVPDIVEFVDEFPLTGVGKVSKKDQ